MNLTHVTYAGQPDVAVYNMSAEDANADPMIVAYRREDGLVVCKDEEEEKI